MVRRSRGEAPKLRSERDDGETLSTGLRRVRCDAARTCGMEPNAIDPSLYKEALVVLGAAGVVIPLFHRLRVSSVLGFMLVGIVVGPFGIASFSPSLPWLSAITITERESIEPIA